MKKIVLICEKPSLAKYVIDELYFVEPEMDHAAFAIGWASEFYLLNSAFRFKRGESYSSFPLVREPEYKEIDFDGRYLDAEKCMAAKRGISSDQAGRRTTAFDAVIDMQEFVACVRNADVVYIAIDPCASGYHAQLRVRRWLSDLGGAFEVKHIQLFSLTSADIHVGVRDADEIPDLETKAKLSVVRRYFDYNYLLNAFPVMGMTFEKAFGKRFRWPLSKHELQLLYFLRDRKRLSDGQIIHEMSRWRGTGRYDRKGGYDDGMGNPASRATILDNLVKQGFLERASGKVVISEQGKRLLDFLHPDCEDPDQVLRIYEWAQLPVEVAKSKIDRYVKTFFGKQKRYLSKVSQLDIGPSAS
jgi:hypothetical protein